MQPRALTTHSHTPKLTVVEPRGLTVRSVDYYRANPGDTAEARVNRTAHDPAGWAIAQWDPRLFLAASAPANLHSIHSLSGAILASTSVDAGLRVSLFGAAGQPVQGRDGRGSRRCMQYDAQLRLTSLLEQAAGSDAICAERLSYAAKDQAFADHNQCGRLIRHDDPAGALLFNDYGLTGTVLEQERCLANERTAGYPTLSRVNPLGELLSRTDAQGNEQRFSQTLDGLLHAVDLHLNNSVEHLPMVNAITYNAHGQVEQEVAGNGVVTTLEYAAEDGRLKRLLSRLAQSDPLQDLRYLYDPVGNVSSIEDAALPIRYFANQRIEPVSHYRYDTLYRLIEATGWEAGAVKHGPSSAASADPAMPGNYRQTYRYDDGNNLLELTHVGPQNPGHRLVAAAHSNRCLPVRDGIEPDEEDFRSGFDANGNLLQLQPGQKLSWDMRNQLREVRPVERDSGLDDCELYFYGADGMRVRKVRSLQTNAKTIVSQTLYLPGLEIRTHSGTGEELHVIEVATGRGSVRVLHRESEPPKDIANNQQRYSLTDHLGSGTLETDQDAKLITQELYYPFGGTAWSNGDAVQVSYKTVRYSGKEQDATGLYYYGFRYYVPWLQRWLNPDPLGVIDGLNLYAMTLNNPVSLIDRAGTTGEVPQQVNWIWMGTPLPTEAAININNFVNSAPGYSFTLWVDSQAWPSGHGAALQNLSSRVRVADVSDAFQGVSPKVHAAFERERSGPLKNYPAASDIARLALMSKAGVYLDVDVKLAKPFPKTLNASAGLLIHAVGGRFGNAILAAGEGSPVITRALSSIANEYSNSDSNTWMKKRSFPRLPELSAAEEVKSAALRTLEHELAEIESEITNSIDGVPYSLLEKDSEKRLELASAQELEAEYFSPSARVTETMKITGTGLISRVLAGVTDSVYFDSGLFQPVDGGGDAIHRRPLLRRASVGS